MDGFGWMRPVVVGVKEIYRNDAFRQMDATTTTKSTMEHALILLGQRPTMQWVGVWMKHHWWNHCDC
jgi:hypothetical protein